MRNTRIGALCATISIIFLGYAATSGAFEFFDDGGGAGLPDCATCHAAIANRGPGHDIHRDLANGDCGSCHDNGEGPGNNSPPLVNCVRCHGRDEDGVGSPDFSAGIGRGLRQHHVTKGSAACGNCHADSNNGTVGSAAENVLPSFFPLALGGLGLDPCDGSEEQFTSNSVSLDNDGDGLTDGADPDCTQATPTPGDFDFDGKADILWRNATTEEVYFWKMNGPEITSSASVATPSTLNWEIVGTGDYNGDNKADILWRNSVSRQVYYWQMDGSMITSSSRVATLSSDNWQVIGSGDYDGDGNDDIMWRHVGVGGSGEIYYWRMEGSTILSSARVAFLTDLNWQAVGSGNYDGDANSDLMWRHDLTGQVYYWRMNGSTILSSAAVATPSDLKWRVVGNGDYNGDGMDDLMWRNIGVGGSGKVYYWQMNGSTITASSRVSIVSDLNWSVVGDGDYDGDGNADMLWLHGTNGQIYYWQQDGFTTLDPSPVSTLTDLDWEVVYTE